MQITPKARLAVTALLDLALHPTHGPRTLAGIQARQRTSSPLSPKTVGQLFSRLRQHGIVYSIHGPGGGYSLARKPADITVADIVRAVEPSKRANTRPDKPGAHDLERADQRISSNWGAEFERTISEFLASVNLQDLAAQSGLCREALAPTPAPAQPRSGIGMRQPPVVIAANPVLAAPCQVRLEYSASSTTLQMNYQG